MPIFMHLLFNTDFSQLIQGVSIAEEEAGLLIELGEDPCRKLGYHP